MTEGPICTPPSICDVAQVELARDQMRLHRQCRLERCAWKWVAYFTLVHHGRVVPPELSPRERAYLRGIEFRLGTVGYEPSVNAPEPETFQQVLDGLALLAHPVTSHYDDEN